ISNSNQDERTRSSLPQCDGIYPFRGREILHTSIHVPSVCRLTPSKAAARFWLPALRASASRTKVLSLVSSTSVGTSISLGLLARTPGRERREGASVGDRLTNKKRCSGNISSSQRTTALSTTLRSSRTFPSHVCVSSVVAVLAPSRGGGFPRSAL